MVNLYPVLPSKAAAATIEHASPVYFLTATTSKGNLAEIRIRPQRWTAASALIMLPESYHPKAETDLRPTTRT